MKIVRSLWLVVVMFTTRPGAGASTAVVWFAVSISQGGFCTPNGRATPSTKNARAASGETKGTENTGALVLGVGVVGAGVVAVGVGDETPDPHGPLHRQ
ncbi:MAG: hypothetical protein WC815_14105 [Vicinamibacterales bacterium]